jgi:hypothetical protein
VVLLAVFSGIALGLYQLAWRGGVVVLAVRGLYKVIRSLMDYGAERAGDDMVLVFGIAGVIALVIASPTIAPHSMSALYVIAMVSVAAFPLILRLLSRQGHRMKLSCRSTCSDFCVGTSVLTMLLISPRSRDMCAARWISWCPRCTLSIMEMISSLPGGDFRSG